MYLQELYILDWWIVQDDRKCEVHLTTYKITSKIERNKISKIPKNNIMQSLILHKL